MNKNLFQSIIPFVAVFIAVSCIIALSKSLLNSRGVNINVLLTGNVLLFFVSLATFLITNKSLQSSNPQAFVRAMYGGFIIKFFCTRYSCIYLYHDGKEKCKQTSFNSLRSSLYNLYRNRNEETNENVVEKKEWLKKKFL